MTEPKRVMRASELYPTGQLFMGGVGSNDITQGAVGDCFFVGAVSALASAPSSLKPLERLFVFSDVKWGIYGVCFFKNGEWEWVIVDAQGLCDSSTLAATAGSFRDGVKG